MKTFYKKTKQTFLLVLIFTSLWILSSCNELRTSKHTFEKPNLFPEGIAYDNKKGKIFVSSMKFGTVGVVETPSYQYTPFIEDSRLISVVGITVDSKRRRIYVLNGDLGVSVKTTPKTQKTLATVAVYHLDTKKELAYLDLAKLASGNHFLNEITIAADGTAYVTDSFNSVIYKITEDFQTSVLVKDKRFSGEGFNLNGIAVDESGKSLIAVKYNSGELFKININSKKVEKIKLDESIKSLNLKGGDGLVLSGNNAFLVYNRPGDDGMVQLKFNNNFTKIEKFVLLNNLGISSSNKELNQHVNLNLSLNFPTTVVQRSSDLSELYVLNPSLGDLFQGKERSQFTINKISGLTLQ